MATHERTLTSAAVRRRSTAAITAAALVAATTTVLGALGATPASAAAPGPVCSGQTCTVTFGYSGSLETFTVPVGVTSVEMDAYGASGGFGGGYGGRTYGTLAVAPGDELTALVGEAGAAGAGARYGGGGAVGAGGSWGSGGGGSFVFDHTGAPVLAAGGGGGAVQAAGGAGAGAGGTGGNGIISVFHNSDDVVAGGASPSGAGGAGYRWPYGWAASGSGPAAGFAPGQGGAGGNNSSPPSNSGAGGGGGYYGGGGGSAYGSGGGGSGFAAPSVTSVLAQSGVRGGYGVVSFTYARRPSTLVLTASPADASQVGDSVTLTGTVGGDLLTPTGTVTFTTGGNTIAGCASRAVSGGVATCTTTGLAPGTQSLAASYGGDTVYAPADATPSSFAVSYPPLTVTSSSIPSGTVDSPYSSTLDATGGLAPHTWSIASGSLPAGVTLSPSGVLSGTPTQATDGMAFSVTVTDAQDPDAYTDTAAFSFEVARAAQAVTFTSTAPSSPTVGDSYTVQTSSGSGSGEPVTISVGSGTTHDACSVTGDAVSFQHVGTCEINADRAGNDDYNAAPTVQQQVEVGMTTQTVAFTSTPPATPTVGDTYDVVTSGGDSGEPVLLSLGSGTTNDACSLVGSTVTFQHVGTCEISADQAGNSDYAAAQAVSQELEVAGIPTTTSLSLPADAVYGEPVAATATVTDAGEGEVQFTLDGDDFGPPVTLESGGTVDSTELTAPGGALLERGTHEVGATFIPTDLTIHLTSTATPESLTVESADTTTALTVGGSSLTASVDPAGTDDSGVPTGTVTFTVGGDPVGTATLVPNVTRGSSAVLDYAVPSGQTQQVGVAYEGDDNFNGSSDSTARQDPTITATTSSAVLPNAAGWYRAPVEVSFECATAGSALVEDCPAPVVLARSAGAQSVSRSISAEDGGTATATVSGIDIDRVAPRVSVSGVGNSAVNARCVATDPVSGVKSCTVLRKRISGDRYLVTATAVDQAGNRAVTRKSTRHRSTRIARVAFRNGGYAVRPGHTYTVVAYAGSRPTLVRAAPAPKMPAGQGQHFKRQTDRRWALRVTFPRSMASHPVWNLGVKVGNQVRIVKVYAKR